MAVAVLYFQGTPRAYCFETCKKFRQNPLTGRKMIPLPRI